MFQISQRPNVNSVVKRAHCISFFFMIQEASGGETPHPRVQNPRSDEIAIELSSYGVELWIESLFQLTSCWELCIKSYIVLNIELKIKLFLHHFCTSHET